MQHLSDPEFQEKLLSFLCRDANFLRECGRLLTSDDFKPKAREPQEAWRIAQIALDFWERYREPVEGMLQAEIMDFSRKARLGEKEKMRLLDMAQRVRSNGLRASEAVSSKIIEFKKEQLKGRTIQELIEVQQQGELTDDRWLDLCYRAIDTFGSLTLPQSDYFEDLEGRIRRRSLEAHRSKYPLFMIDGLDEKIRGIGRGEVGLWLAFAKVGKSLALIHTALACVLQRMNVLLFTLEDPLMEMENRMDSNVASLPTKDLHLMPKRLRLRFQRFTRLLKARIKIIDGTDGTLSVPRMEEIWERERNRGFKADVVVVDYDDEIRPSKKQKERRFEFADIYRDLRTFAARKQVVLWTAAQAIKKSEGKRMITANMVAEDISKIRKVSLAIGIGIGDWGPESRYLYVIAHKFDKQSVGCEIMSDPDRAIFYEPHATTLQAAKWKVKKAKERADADAQDGD